MEAFKIRLIHEERQLSRKVQKLEHFVIVSEKFKELSHALQTCLTSQLDSMKKYQYSLQERMSILDVKTNELTPGQKAAGVSFNPSNLSLVDDLKDMAAEFIDTCGIERENAGRGEKGRYFSKAISAIENGQMDAVKAATWQHD